MILSSSQISTLFAGLQKTAHTITLTKENDEATKLISCV